MDKKIYVNLESRTIFITDTINDQNMGYVAFNLLHMIKEDDICEEQMKDFEREPIHIHIMSPGGSVTAAWAIVDIIENSKTPIHTYCNGYAYSAGLLLFVSGHKRFVYKHSTLMYHQVAKGMCYPSFVQDWIEDTIDMKKTQDVWEEYFLEKTKVTKEKLEEVRTCKKDWYMDAEEAIALGIATDNIK